MSAIGYLRVSTVEQVEGYGLEVQRQAIKGYCDDHGLELVVVCSDEGQSGKNGLDTRTGLADALGMIEAGDVDALVCYRLDRLARDLVLQETLLARIGAAGTQVLSVTEPDIDSDDPTRVLVRQVLGAIAQYERALIRSRMQAGAAVKRAAGGYAGGRPRFGFRAVDRELAPDPEEQDTIAMARSLRVDGLTLRAIAVRLERAGKTTKGSGNWHAASVRRLLG